MWFFRAVMRGCDLLAAMQNPRPDSRRRHARAALVVVFAGVSLALAQERDLRDTRAVGDVLRLATREILLTVPSVRSRDVAEGLRRAALERGARVFVLADVSLVQEPSGYLAGLSLVKNIQVRLLRGVSVYRAVVDRSVLVSGGLLFDMPTPLEPRPTTASTKTRAWTEAAAWFTRAWTQARPYTFQPRPQGR